MNAPLLAVDSNVVAGITQAIATVIAVLVGYGLSFLNERSNRKRLDETASRERQLNTLIDLIDALSALRDATGIVARSLTPYFAMDGSTGTGATSRQAALAAARRSSDVGVDAARLAHQRIGRLVLAVSVLGFADDVAGKARDSADIASKLLVDVDTALSGDSTDDEALVHGVDTVGRCIDELLRLGRELT